MISVRADAQGFLSVVAPDSTSAAVLNSVLAAETIPTNRHSAWHAVASVLVVAAHGRVLLARTSRGWGTAGGHVEEHDLSLRHAARREAQEELALDIPIDALVPVSFVSDVDPVSPAHAHYDFCFLHVVPAPVVATAGDDVSEAAWFDFDALPLLNEHMAAHVEAVRRAVAPRTILLGEDGPGSVDRHAVRAVIERAGNLLLLRSRAGDYKFPGGGVEAGEDDHTALARELREECGRDLLRMDGLVLVVRERRADLEDPTRMFTMESRYYRCAVGEAATAPRLSSFEKDLGLMAAWVSRDDACTANEVAEAEGHPWVGRELAVLRALAD